MTQPKTPRTASIQAWLLWTTSFLALPVGGYAATMVSLGWVVTTVAHVAVDQQFIVFGASGAVLVTAIAGLLLSRLIPAAPSPWPAIARSTAKVPS